MHDNVEKHLNDSGIEFKIRKHTDSNKKIISPLDFSEFLGYDLSRITKTLFLKSGQSQFLCLVSSVLARANLKSIAKQLSVSRLQIATKAELSKLLDYPPMGVSPLGTTCPTLVDEGLLSHDSILVGGGNTGVEIELTPEDLVSITNATTGKFCFESSD